MLISFELCDVIMDEWCKTMLKEMKSDFLQCEIRAFSVAPLLDYIVAELPRQVKESFCEYGEYIDFEEFKKFYIDFVRMLKNSEYNWKSGSNMSELKAHVDSCDSEHFNLYMNRFWNKYVGDTKMLRYLSGREILFWGLLATVYMAPLNHEKGGTLRNLKHIMKRREEDANLNEVLHWCIGCYIEIMEINYDCFLEGQIPDPFIERFGRKQHMAGVFSFLENFDYKRNQIMEFYTWNLEKFYQMDTSNMDIEVLMMLVSAIEWHVDADDPNRDKYLIPELSFPMTKKNIKGKHQTDGFYISEYTGAGMKACQEFFRAREYERLYSLYSACKDIKHIETQEDYKNQVNFLFNRLITDFFLGVEPDTVCYGYALSNYLCLHAITSMLSRFNNEANYEKYKDTVIRPIELGSEKGGSRERILKNPKIKAVYDCLIDVARFAKLASEGIKEVCDFNEDMEECSYEDDSLIEMLEFWYSKDLSVVSEELPIRDFSSHK